VRALGLKIVHKLSPANRIRFGGTPRDRIAASKISGCGLAYPVSLEIVTESKNDRMSSSFMPEYRRGDVELEITPIFSLLAFNSREPLEFPETSRHPRDPPN